jgi:hypothetical protein
MSLASTDLVLCGALDMEETDGTTEGGGIDTTTLLTWSDPTTVNALATTLKYVSSNTGDTTQSITVTGRSSTGAIITETINPITGTTVITGTVTFQEILKATMSATAVGTISIKRSTDSDVLLTMPPGIKQVRRLFYNVSADVGTGSTRNYYDKGFLQNNNGTNAALGLTVQILTQPGGGASVQVAVESSVNGTGTSTNRQTAPSGITGAGFGDGPTSIPGTDLAPGAAIGIWFNLTLTAGLAADRTTFVPEWLCSTT